MNEPPVLHFGSVLVQCFPHFISRTRDWCVHRHPCFLFSIHTLQFTSLTWHHCRNTCWFRVQLCNRLLLVVFWMLAYSLLRRVVVFRTVSSCHLVSSVFCFVRFVCRAPRFIYIGPFCFAKQLVRHFLWFRSSPCPSSTMCSCLRLPICSSHLVGIYQYIRTINMKAVTFSIQAIDN